MKNKVKGVSITFCCPSDVVEKLDEICSLSGVKRSQFFINAICTEYERYNENPKLRELLSKLKDVNSVLQELQGSSRG